MSAFTWSEDDLTVREAVRSWVDKVVRPARDDLEHGGVPPYEIARNYYETFGIGEAAAEKFDWEIARDEALIAGTPFDVEQPEGLDASTMTISNIELVKVCPGIPTSIGISAGMTADYPEAIAAGATHLRIGSAITGPRPAHG